MLRALRGLLVPLVLATSWLPAAEGSVVLAPRNVSTLLLGVVVPDTLLSGADASSSFGVNATSARTSLHLKSNAQDVPSLLVLRSASSGAQQAKLAFRSASGLGNVTGATLSIGGTTQVVITNGVVTQSSGSLVAIASGSSITLGGSGMSTNAQTDTASLVFSLVANPSSDAGARSTLTWTIDIT